jgi:hypothetical protein
VQCTGLVSQYVRRRDERTGGKVSQISGNVRETRADAYQEKNSSRGGKRERPRDREGYGATGEDAETGGQQPAQGVSLGEPIQGAAVLVYSYV